jgi:hypothetical protein
MENAAIINSPIHDANLFGTLRSPEIEPDKIETFSFEGGINRGTDIVELSGESIQLSRAASNEPAREAAAGIAESDNNTEENPENETLLLNNETAIVGLSPEDESEILTANVNEGTGDGTGSETLLAAEPGGVGETAAQIITAGTEELDTTLNIPVFEDTAVGETGETEFFNDQIASLNQFQNSTITSSPRTAAGSVREETPPAQVGAVETETNTPPENENNLESQAHRVTEINNIRDRANGTQEAPAQPFDVSGPQQATPNQEQILLQNVGTQLAQTVPPASIISVLG